MPPEENREERGAVLSLDGVKRLYEDSLAHHGLSSKGVGWKDTDSQLLRFEKLAQVFDPRGGDEEAASVSINDLGCGYGAMFQYLCSLPRIRVARYYGYDISDEMLEAARRTAASDPRATFIQSRHVTEEADYSFVSGTFNVKLEASDSEWSEYVKELLLNLAAKSRRGFAFNLFTTYVDWREEHLYYADPSLFFDFCKRNISRYVSLLHDYPLFEWTMIVRKDERAR